jgi:hypothetical protein
MAISADEIFAQTMSKELIEASDKRALVLIDEYERLQALRKARAMT